MKKGTKKSVEINEMLNLKRFEIENVAEKRVLGGEPHRKTRIIIPDPH